MTWQSVGTHSFVPTDKAVQVGSFDLAAGQDTIWVRITQLNPVDDWPWSYGILSWRNANGTPLGSIKAYSNRLGEVFRLGNGLPPSDGTGSIWFEPRGFNLGWLKAGFPWELQFEAQAGGSDVTTSYWNRDPQNGILTPVVLTDEIRTTGSVSADGGAFTSDVSLGAVFVNGTDDTNSAAYINSDGSAGWNNGTIRFETSGLCRFYAPQTPTNGRIYFHINGDAINITLPSGTPKAWFTYDGNATFAGQVHASNVTFRSTDPNLMTAKGYIGPELDLLEEIVRLESLVKHLYDTLRLSPPAGWDVWDGNTDVVMSRGKKKGHI